MSDRPAAVNTYLTLIADAAQNYSAEGIAVITDFLPRISALGRSAQHEMEALELAKLSDAENRQAFNGSTNSVAAVIRLCGEIQQQLRQLSIAVQQLPDDRARVVELLNTPAEVSE